MKKGFLIVLESVKTTEKLKQAVRIYKWLKSKKYDVVLTHEPLWNHGKIGNILENMLGKTDNPVFEALLYAVDRAKHVEKIIEPNLKKGKIVICDRYIHSSLAFQTASGVDLKWVREINKFFPKPDLAFYLDSNPEKSDSEKKKIRTDYDLELQKKARKIYLKLVRKEELIKINVTNSEEIFSKIKKIISKKLNI